jgi:two-component system, OmpR family, response regulator
MLQALIIDDEMDICFLLGKILRAKNIQATYVNSISAATTALQITDPQIVFLDNHLPDGLGTDFLAVVKQQAPAAKVIMITAFDNYTDRNKALTNGADTFVPKPFTKEHIFNELEKLMH